MQRWMMWCLPQIYDHPSLGTPKTPSLNGQPGHGKEIEGLKKYIDVNLRRRDLRGLKINTYEDLKS